MKINKKLVIAVIAVVLVVVGVLAIKGCAKKAIVVSAPAVSAEVK